MIKKALLFYGILMFVSIFNQGCHCPDLKIIGNGTMQVVPLTSEPSPGTITGLFGMLLILETETAAVNNTFSIIPSTLAWSCDEVVVNPVDLESLTLSCSRDFTLNGALIEAGTDFLNEEFMVVSNGGNAFVEINFNQAFMDSTVFEQGVHEFTIELKTEDDRSISNSAMTSLAL